MSEAAQEEPRSEAATQQNVAGGDPATRSPHMSSDHRETTSEQISAKVAELRGLAESLEARENSHLSETITASVGMVAASLGAAAATAAGGAEIGGVLLALVGIVGSIVPFVGRWNARRRRKPYTSVADIQDPMVRALFEVTAAQQVLGLARVHASPAS
jgi:Flp pilus assembly protein TadB